MEDFYPVLHQSVFMFVDLHIMIMMMMAMMVVINNDVIIAIIDIHIFLPYRWSFTPSQSLYGTCYYTPVIQPEANKQQAEKRAKRAPAGDKSATILDQKKKKELKHRHRGVLWLGW